MTSTSVQDLLPRRTPYRTWPGALAVLVTAIVYVGSLVVWNSKTPSPDPVVPGVRVEVGHGLEYLPATGWTLDAPVIRAKESHGLVREAASFSIQVHTWTGTPQEPLARARRMLNGGKQFKETIFPASEQSFRTANGLEGMRLGFSGKRVQGELWVVVDTQRQLAITVRAQATPSQYAGVRPQIMDMIDSLRWKDAP